MPLPTPEEVKRRGGEILHYTSKREFEKAGGRTTDPLGHGMDYVVVAAPAEYNRGEGTENPMEAIDAYWDLFKDGGWTVFVWDTRKGEGWAYQYVGPDWTNYLPAGAAPSAPAPRAPAPGGAPPRSAVSSSQADIDTINRHRARIGADPIDVSAGWTSEELHQMAENIRTRGTEHNPELKRRLMR